MTFPIELQLPGRNSSRDVAKFEPAHEIKVLIT